MTADLPWDRFGPEPEEEELPYNPPPRPYPPEPEPPDEPIIYPHPPAPDAPPLPQPTAPVVDWNKLLDDAWPVIKDQLVGYVRGTIKAGFDVDHANPTITGETVTGKELVIADARNRSWRTLVQGLIFDIMFAVVAAVTMLSGADPFIKETWIAFGVLLFKSVISAVISYFMRLKVSPTVRTKGEQMTVLPLMVPKPEPEAELAAG